MATLGEKPCPIPQLHHTYIFRTVVVVTVVRFGAVAKPIAENEDHNEIERSRKAPVVEERLRFASVAKPIAIRGSGKANCSSTRSCRQIAICCRQECTSRRQILTSCRYITISCRQILTSCRQITTSCRYDTIKSEQNIKQGRQFAVQIFFPQNWCCVTACL